MKGWISVLTVLICATSCEFAEARLGACRPGEITRGKVTACDPDDKTKCVRENKVIPAEGWTFGKCQSPQPTPEPETSVCCVYSSGHVETADSASECPAKDAGDFCLTQAVDDAHADGASCVPNNVGSMQPYTVYQGARNVPRTTVIAEDVIDPTCVDPTPTETSTPEFTATPMSTATPTQVYTSACCVLIYGFTSTAGNCNPPTDPYSCYAAGATECYLGAHSDGWMGCVNN